MLQRSSSVTYCIQTALNSTTSKAEIIQIMTNLHIITGSTANYHLSYKALTTAFPAMSALTLLQCIAYLEDVGLLIYPLGQERSRLVSFGPELTMYNTKVLAHSKCIAGFTVI